MLSTDCARLNLTSPVTEPDPDLPCLVGPTQQMTTIVVARLVDTALVVMVIVIEAPLVEATMMMIVVDTVLLPELVVQLMIIHPRVAGSRILTVVIIPLILTSMAGLLMIDLHQGITHQEIILQRTMIALAVTGMFHIAIHLDLMLTLNRLQAEKRLIRSALMMKCAFLHKGPTHPRDHSQDDCDVVNEFLSVSS